MTTHHDTSPQEETMAQKILPWMENSDDPSPTHLADSIPNNEPVIAHVPTWVNNLSYSHITETGSPYVSPQTTVIPYPTDNHKPIFSLFPPKEPDPPDDEIDNTLQSSDYFPAPWAHNGIAENDECPQVSHMLSEKTGERSGDYLHSTHTEKAPEHHHVIIPTNQGSDHSSNVHNNTHLSEVASAPDIHHWKPLAKNLYTELTRLQSDSMLEEMAYQEGVKNRVQDWLRRTSVDDENDADEEDETDEEDMEGQDAVFDNKLKQLLEEELDREMNSKK